jgi:nitrile hydratase accessory protein
MSDSPSINREAAQRAAEAVPSIPRDANGPVFGAPWEAHAFAMTLALYQKGLFAWSDWAAMLGEEIKKAQAAGDPDSGETYYRHWLAALERMVAEKGLTTRQSLTEHFQAWESAMRRTPHGKPIELQAQDFSK